MSDEALYTEDQVPAVDRVLGIRGLLGEQAIRQIKQNMRATLRSAKSGLPAEEVKILERTVEDFLSLRSLAAPLYLAASTGYADIPLGKGFSVVYSKSDLAQGATTQCVLRAVVNEWTPIAMDGIPHGHKSVCMFDFPQGTPELLLQLPKVGYPTPVNVEERVYLCTQETWELRKPRR